MGAQVALDLRTETTHLVATTSTSLKYTFVAKSRADVVVIDREWVNEMHALWTAGEDINVKAFEEKHKLPTFLGVKVSITAFLEGMSHVLLLE